MADQDKDAFGKVHVPLGESGSGLYSLATLGCFNVIEKAKEMTMSSAESVSKLPGNNVLTLADYGCADGGTSLPLFNVVIDRLKSINPSREIHVVYEDQANNDWKSLFLYTQNKLKVEGYTSNNPTYFEKYPGGVFVSAVGESFHKQVLPSHSLHLGFSSTAMHWLSSKPANLPALHHSQCAPCDELNLYKIQAAKDWENILLARSKELVDHGELVIVNFCIDSKGQCLGRTYGPNAPSAIMYDTFMSIWKNMMTQGTITEEEFNNTTFINYYRNAEEMTGCLTDPNSKLYQSGLRLVSYKEEVTSCPYRQKWLNNSSTLNPQTHAHDYVLTTRTWSNSTFESSLNTTRSIAEKKSIVNQLYTEYERIVAENPANHGMDYVHIFLNIKKVPTSALSS